MGWISDAARFIGNKVSDASRFVGQKLGQAADFIGSKGKDILAGVGKGVGIAKNVMDALSPVAQMIPFVNTGFNDIKGIVDSADTYLNRSSNPGNNLELIRDNIHKGAKYLKSM